MTSRILLAVAILSAVAACEIGGEQVTTGASTACVPVGAACARDADCCSYGCVAGICAANPVEGGACHDTNDCAASRLCKSAACTTPTPGMCRDTGDVCSLWSQCCSGNCEGGDCTVNRPPAVSAGPDVPDAPYTRPFTLANGSADPDGDPLSFGWSFVSLPAGSAAALSSATAATPTFTPDKEGAYVVRLVVTEGPIGAPDRYTLEDQVTIVAVNRAPVATATAPAASWSRNVAIAIAGTASDPDGDALECAWRVTAPGAPASVEIAPFAPCANPSTPSVQHTPGVEGTYVVELVVRDHDRTSGELRNTTVATASFVSRNDAPVPSTTRPTYYANMGPPSGTTPAVTVDASPSTDPNGDQVGTPGLGYFWEMVSASDGGALPALTAFDTATPSFVPERAADYVLQVTVSDPAQFGRASATATMQVTVVVGRHVQLLGHTVVDAARAKDANKIVLAGPDPGDGTKGMIWLYDMATGTEGAGIRLVDPADGVTSGLPRLVDVTPDGTKVVVVDASVSLWIVTLGATPSMIRVIRPFIVDDVVVAGNRFAFVLGGEYDTVRQLDLNASTSTGALSTPGGWPGYGSFGAAYHSATAAHVYRVDEAFDVWYRSAVNNSGAQTGYAVTASGPTCGAGYPAPLATAIWATQHATFANAYVVSSCGKVYRADTLADLGQTLGLSPSFVDSTAAGAILAVSGAQLALFDGNLNRTGTDAIPRWAWDGHGPSAYPSRAFFNAEGTRRFAIVSTSSPTRHGVVTFP